MSDAVEKASTERLIWAECREPYKTELDRLARHWIDGSLSDEKLAFKAVQILSELDWVTQPDAASQKISVDDVVSQLKILTEAMLACSDNPECTPAMRRQAFDFMQKQLTDHDDKGR